MGTEIERKFLVKSDGYKTELSSNIYIKQGYFSNGVRVRLSKAHKNEGFITFKYPTEGMTRIEYEYPIPYSDALEILENLCEKPIIEKIRHIVFHCGERWEVDEFLGDNKGLVIAELEMDNEDYDFKIPEWLGPEVTHLKKYYNADLTEKPFKLW